MVNGVLTVPNADLCAERKGKAGPKRPYRRHGRLVKNFQPIEDGIIEHLRLQGWSLRKIARYMSTDDHPRAEATIRLALHRMAMWQERAET